jgi:hypothetical protein
MASISHSQLSAKKKVPHSKKPFYKAFLSCKGKFAKPSSQAVATPVQTHYFRLVFSVLQASCLLAALCIPYVSKAKLSDT